MTAALKVSPAPSVSTRVSGGNASEWTTTLSGPIASAPFSAQAQTRTALRQRERQVRETDRSKTDRWKRQTSQRQSTGTNFKWNPGFCKNWVQRICLNTESRAEPIPPLIKIRMWQIIKMFSLSLTVVNFNRWSELEQTKWNLFSSCSKTHWTVTHSPVFNSAVKSSHSSFSRLEAKVLSDVFTDKHLLTRDGNSWQTDSFSPEPTSSHMKRSLSYSTQVCSMCPSYEWHVKIIC